MVHVITCEHAVHEIIPEHMLCLITSEYVVIAHDSVEYVITPEHVARELLLRCSQLIIPNLSHEQDVADIVPGHLLFLLFTNNSLSLQR